jgi:GAF domain-containing protein
MATSVSTAPIATGWIIDESTREATIDEFDLVALRDTGRLDRITAFAARLCGAPFALVSLVERDRQSFLARTGLAVCETPRATSFCAHAMLGQEIMVVPDATLDPRFADNPLVTGDPYIRFYAGAPLLSDDGIPLGSLCVIDRLPRTALTDLQYQGLEVLAEAVMAAFREHRATR